VIIPIDIDNLNHEHIFEKLKEFLLNFIGDFLSVFQFVTTNNVYCYAKMLTQNRLDRKNLAIIDEAVTLDVFKKRLLEKIYIKLILKHTNESIKFVNKRKEVCEYVKIPIKRTQGVKDSLLDRMAVSFANNRIIFCVDDTKKIDEGDLNIFFCFHSDYYTFVKSKYKNQKDYIEKHVKPTLEDKKQFEKIIQPVLDWISKIIVREDKIKYEFMIMWIAKLLQFANFRDNKTILI